MDEKKQVLTGLVLTAFFTSLAIFELIPGIVMAILVLVAGIAITYYFVLSRMRLESLADISILLRAAKEIAKEKQTLEICRKLSLWTQRLVKAEAVLICWQGEWMLGEAEYTSWPGLEIARDWVNNNREILILKQNGGEIFSHPWPDNIKSIIGLPLSLADEVTGILFLLNEGRRGYFTHHDSRNLEVICQQAAVALDKAHDYHEMEKIHQKILLSLVNTLDAHFPGFAGHSERVAQVALLLGQKMALDEEELLILEQAAILHDIGKIYLLRKDHGEEEADKIQEDRPLTLEEHPVLGAQTLPDEGIFARIREGILYHHERYDGSGYPDGLSHTDIPLTARIIAVADLYDALTHLAPEEERLGAKAAVKEMKKTMGMLLDPLLVVALEEVEAELDRIY